MTSYDNPSIDSGSPSSNRSELPCVGVSFYSSSNESSYKLTINSSSPLSTGVPSDTSSSPCFCSILDSIRCSRTATHSLSGSVVDWCFFAASSLFRPFRGVTIWAYRNYMSRYPLTLISPDKMRWKAQLVASPNTGSTDRPDQIWV